MTPKQNEGIVLLVDDEEAIREAVGDLLDACGFTVYTADCYDSAVRELKKHRDIEAVLSDLKMPGKSGVEVLRYLNGLDGIGIPLVFLTGFATLESCQEAVREGAFDYILKPIDDKDKIVFPLRHAVEKHRLEKNNAELQRDIIQMAEEHKEILDTLLDDTEIKTKVQDRIATILDKWSK